MPNTNFQENPYLPPRTIRHLLITAEHAGFQYRGGIGSYAQEMEDLLGPDHLGVFFVGEKEYAPNKFPSQAFLKEKQRIVPSRFFSHSHCAALPKEDLAYDCLRRILPLYPNLETVEIQDCDGFGVRIAQAKRAGLLPANLKVKIRCHGTYVYLEQAHGKWWADQYHLRLMAREKQALEQADVVSFPTDFLHTLYLNSGYAIDPNRVEKLRYPLALPPIPVNTVFQKADTLIFLGARTSMKGFHIFTQALKQLLPSQAGQGLKQIFVLGSQDPSMARENAFVQSLKSRVAVTEASLPRHKLLETLTALRSRAVCVLPYPGDNHPNAVLEAMACGCPMIAANRGGIPELVPRAFHQQVLCEPNPNALADSIVRAMAMNPQERQNLAEDIQREFSVTQEFINQAHLNLFGKKAPEPEPIHPEPEPIHPEPRKTLLLVCTENPSQSLRQALDNQTRKPDQILFIARSSFPVQLEALAKNHQTAILITLDPDYLPEPVFVQSHARYLENNPQTAAVSAYCQEQGGAFDRKHSGAIIRPLGDGLLLNLCEECLGHPGAAFSLTHLDDLKLENIAELEGPEDLFPAILGARGKIGVIPEILSQRKARPGSDKNFHQGMALARHARNLPPFEALRLAGVMQDYAAMQQTPAIAIARELENYPSLQRIGKGLLQIAAKVYFKLKDLMLGKGI
ncbi:MAG: glycosyltransferase family 4 protein [Desulfatibacillum sp.]|nr:glycosyltransferase family 4 protein [Desulfatibacillum sp.]